MREISQEEKKRIYNMRKSGFKLRQICAATELSMATIHRIILDQRAKQTKEKKIIDVSL